ncbi:chemotaxis protein CheW [Spirochaeta cellobiosiphila]|uniref:chemotaxis protein CheW n=1 Tax=Spirochaeta cellobiosiphila TaxID=504483 RepID=UPI00040735B2|nr:chemotaxis protein CheW [Spirochaeta cellobiosiphila]
MSDMSSFLGEDKEDEDMLVSQLNMDVSNQYVVFSVGEEEYGIPILSVQEIISMPNLTKLPGVPEFIPGIINLRGNIIPLYVLRSKFELTLHELDKNTIVIIVQIGDAKMKTVGFIVDAVSDVVSIDKENLRDTPEFSGNVDVRYVDKIGHIGSRMIILIDLDSFFSEKETVMLESVTEMKSSN